VKFVFVLAEKGRKNVHRQTHNKNFLHYVCNATYYTLGCQCLAFFEQRQEFFFLTWTSAVFLKLFHLTHPQVIYSNFASLRIF